MKAEQNKHRLVGNGGLITHKWHAELKLMMELIGSLHSPGSKFNLQSFPGLKGLTFSHQHDRGVRFGVELPSITQGSVPCQHYVTAYLF